MPVHGRAGASLSGDAAFASSKGAADAGRQGEVLTAAVLNMMAQDRGFAVFHDLAIPGTKANVDHVVVAGNKVWVIDSKRWKPGFYWTLGGRTRRGGESFPSADKRGLPLVRIRLAQFLVAKRLDVQVQRPLMVVHNTRPAEKQSLWAYRPRGDEYPRSRPRVVRPDALSFPAVAADPRIVQALAPLVATP